MCQDIIAVNDFESGDLAIKSILGLNPVKRIEYILRHDHPEIIVPSIPPEEIFLTIKEAEDDEILSIMEYTTPEQFNFILDIELWSQDRLNPEKFKRWVHYLSLSKYETITKYLEKINLELMALGFSLFVRIYFRAGEEDKRDLKGDTLDGVYFFQFTHAWAREPFLKILSIMRAEMGAIYYQFLVNIFGGIRSEAEYEEFRMRNARMSSFGFPEYDTAKSIYRGMTYKELINGPGKNYSIDLKNHQANRTVAGYSKVPPNYPVLLSEGRSLLFDSLLKMLEDPLKDEVLLEIAYLSNCIIIADNVDDITKKTIMNAVRRAKSYLSISLESLSLMDKEEKDASYWIKAFYLKSLFSYAFYQVRLLKKKAAKLLKTGIFECFQKRDEIYDFMGDSISSYFRCLFMRIPMFYHENTSLPESCREFESISDIRYLEDIIDGFYIYETILSKLFLISKKEIYDFYISTNCNMLNCISTLFFRMLWKKETCLKPFSGAELAELINSLKKEEQVFSKLVYKIEDYINENIEKAGENCFIKKVIIDSVMNLFDEIRGLDYLSPDGLKVAVSSLLWTYKGQNT